MLCSLDKSIARNCGGKRGGVGKILVSFTTHGVRRSLKVRNGDACGVLNVVLSLTDSSLILIPSSSAMRCNKARDDPKKIFPAISRVFEIQSNFVRS